MNNIKVQENPSYRNLITQVVMEEREAWCNFLNEFSDFIFCLIRRFARRKEDEDLYADLFLYVVQELHRPNDKNEPFYRLRHYLERLDQNKGRANFYTWLAKVIQNLIFDYFRERNGRRSLPLFIRRMDTRSQQIFKLLYWSFFSEQDAYVQIKYQFPALSRKQFDQIVSEINKKLKKCNRWSIYSGLIKRSQNISIKELMSTQIPNSLFSKPLNPTRLYQPAQEVITKEQQDASISLGTILREAIQQLSEESRLLMIFKFKYGASANQIAKLLNLKNEKQVYSTLNTLIGNLKRSVEKAGFAWQQIEDGLDQLEGLLDEFDTQKKTTQRYF